MQDDKSMMFTFIYIKLDIATFFQKFQKFQKFFQISNFERFAYTHCNEDPFFI